MLKLNYVILFALFVMAAARTKEVEENDMPIRGGDRGRVLAKPPWAKGPKPKKTPPKGPPTKAP
jgi:hypothetical protein